MKPTIYYATQEKPMSQLLAYHGVSLKDDFSEHERDELKTQLEKVFKDYSAITLDLKKIRLHIPNVDAAGHLYRYL